MSVPSYAHITPQQEDLRKTLTNPDDVNIIVASIDDAESMQAMASQTEVVVSTAGPFDIIGLPVVDACIVSSTHYVDITGEAPFVRKVIDKHHDMAILKKLKVTLDDAFITLHTS